MNLALRRFRLEGIGPAGARFDPLQVDLTTDGSAARSAVLFLENGGGKSVLLRLLFAVVLPGRRQTVGGAKLEGYVLTGDTGHVALEWDLPDGGRLVTGLVLEWRGRQRSGTAANLLVLWYSFRPLDGALTFDILPTTDGGRRRTRTGFREQLADLARAHPHLQLVVEDQPGRWRDHLLSATPLDPEAFRYQRTMNADEADAESLFAGIKGDDDFVRFVIDAVHDADDLAGFDDLVAAYSHQLARRDTLVVEAAFAAAAAVALNRFAGAWEVRAQGRAGVAAVDAEAVHLRSSIDAGVAAAVTDERRTRDEASAAAERRRALDSQAVRASVTASELRRIEAVLRHTAAVAAEEVARRTVEAAQLRVAAWAVVPVWLARIALVAEAARLREAQEAAERDLTPLRHRAEADEARYATRLRTEAGTLETQAGAARQAAVEADEDATALDTSSRRAVAEAARLEEHRRSLLAEVTRVDEAVAAARSSGLLRGGETVEAGLTRLAETARRAGGALAEARAARARAQADQRAAAGDLLDAERSFDGTSRDLSAVRNELDHRVIEAIGIVAEERAQAIALGATDFWTVAEHLAEGLTYAVQAGRTSVRELDERIRELHAELDALGVDGLLPPSTDVRAVWDALASAGIGAASGWQWLAEKLDGAERTAALGRNPGLAGGVIVADPERLDQARLALVEAGVETAGVVVLGAAPDLDVPSAGVPAPVRPGQYDPAWTERERDRRLAEAGEVDAQLIEARAALAVDEPLADRVGDLLRRCPPATRVELAGRVGRLEADVAARAERLEAAKETQRRADAALVALDDAEPGLITAAARADEDARAGTAVAVQAASATRAADGAATAGEDAQRAHQEADRTATGAEGARRAGERARTEAASAFDAAAALRSKAAGFAAVPVPDPPATEATEGLRAAASASRRAYDSERAGRDLTPLVVDVEGRLAQANQEVGGLHPDLETEVITLAGQPAAGDEGTRRRALSEARRRLGDAEADRDHAVGATGAARELVSQRTPSDRPRHLALDPHDEPVTAQEAADRAAEHGAESLRLTQEARAVGSALQALEEQAGQAGVRAQLLAAAAALLPPLPPADVGETAARDGMVEPWPGVPEAAQAAAERVRRALDEARTNYERAERELERAEAAVRATAADPAHRGVSGLRVALAEEPVESLAPRARSVAVELEAMRSSVESELADIVRHREGLVLRLATLVDHHLGLLGRLARLSTLPDDLGGWSRRPFLIVGFDRHDAASLHARLELVVDTAATGDRRRARPLEVLLAGLRAAVHSGPERPPFKVSILRPNRTMKEERATFAELEREFSGGMKLTAAICTYCALAALRAGSRSTGGLFGAQPGPLFLDNPLGKASADYLLDLQHTLAAKLGVQLVHTTGVWDVEALGAYDRFVRLRNLSDLRANLQQIRVDDVDLGVGAEGTGVDGVAFSARRR